MDLMLPKINGFDVCAALKSDAASKPIHVVIFTTRGRQEEQRCRDLGAEAFFNKLDPPAKMIEAIKSLCD